MSIEKPTIPSLTQAAQGGGPEQDTVGADGLLPSHKFALNYADRRKRLWTGDFEAHVPTYKEMIEIGVIRSRLTLGVAVDGMAGRLVDMIAYLTVTIDKGPAWSKDLDKLYDPTVVAALYEVVASYEARFHGAGSGEAGETADP